MSDFLDAMREKSLAVAKTMWAYGDDAVKGSEWFVHPDTHQQFRRDGFKTPQIQSGAAGAELIDVGNITWMQLPLKKDPQVPVGEIELRLSVLSR